jgi:hypothetical protein
VTSFLATLPVFELDEASVQIFGEAKALLERQGQRLADADLFVGAIAVVQNATVVTGESAALRANPWRRGRGLDPGLTPPRSSRTREELLERRERHPDLQPDAPVPELAGLHLATTCIVRPQWAHTIRPESRCRTGRPGKGPLARPRREPGVLRLRLLAT